VHALRSLLWLQDKLGLMPVQDAKPPTGFDFVELKAEDTSEIEVLLGQLGFTPRGRHRTKPVSLWAAGEARVVLNEQQARDQVPHVAAVGLAVPDADATSRRSADLMAPVAFRRTYAAEQPFGAATAPDGTEFFWVTETPDAPAWVNEFESGATELTPSPIRVIDHVNLTQPWQTAEDAVLFLTSVFGLDTEAPTEVPGPSGLVRSQVLRTADGAIRIPLNVAPHALDEKSLPQHVAFGCTDVIALARSAAAAGLPFLAVPDNYYDYLLGRFGLDEDFVAQLRELNLLYDRSPEGHFVHFYTRTVGTVFFEFVQRFGHYDGYGVDNAPVRLAAQRGGVGTVRR
jgi:4-hydroxyphenylpyruvate dioxygenase